LALLRSMNEEDLAPDDTELAARIVSYELAFRMQKHAPEAVDLARETAATRKMYGLDDRRTADFGTRLLLARRLVERGVRFVQVYSGGGPLVTQWDAHDDINGNHEKMCGHVDRPIAGLLKDLEARGLLKDTLVVWASEFGRTPMSQGGKGPNLAGEDGKLGNWPPRSASPPALRLLPGGHVRHRGEQVEPGEEVRAGHRGDQHRLRPPAAAAVEVELALAHVELADRVV